VFIKILIQYIAPTCLAIIFLVWMWQKLPERWGQICSDMVVRLLIGFILLIALFCLGGTVYAVRRWEKESESTFSRGE